MMNLIIVTKDGQVRRFFDIKDYEITSLFIIMEREDGTHLYFATNQILSIEEER